MLKLPALLIPALAGSTLLLTGALSPQRAGSGAALFTPQAAPADAGRLLDDVIAMLAPSPTSPGAEWLSMSFWQKMTDGENSFEAEGRLISREWKAWRQAAKIKNRETSSPLGINRREKARGSSRSFSASWRELPRRP